MEPTDSITRWIIGVREGDPDAAASLWERYFSRLAAVVRARLGSVRSGAADEADVAASAFQAFFKRIGEGKFPDLRGRDEFWKVLVVIANRKAVSLIRHELAQVHGGGKVRGDAFLGDIASREPDPEVAAELLDESRHLLELVRREDTTLSLIVLRKLAGLSNKEIAAELEVALRTVQRKIERIGILWRADAEKREAE